MRLGHRFSDLGQDGSQVELRFDGGEPAHADVVIGADGIRSRVRAAVGMPTKLENQHNAAYRAVIPADRLRHVDVPDRVKIWMGPHKYFAYFWVNGGAALNAVGYVDMDRGRDEPWTEWVDPQEALEQYAGWHPTVLEIISAAESMSLCGMFDRLAEESWHRGRVVLLGDAAHPILTSYAQGAGQAIEDGATLGTVLAGAGRDELDERLALYDALRPPRVRRIQEVSRALAARFTLPDGPQQEERDKALADEENVYAASAWLYGFDALAVARAAIERS